MTNQYRAIHPSYVAEHGADPVDLDWTAREEDDNLRRGYFELVPRPYRVLVDNYTVDGHPIDQGAVVELALPVENETALVGAGILERTRRDANPTVDLEAVDEPAEPEPPKTKSRPRRKESE